jgi:succinate dehydrogenase / fumarate reductase cytochrome b subunit
MLKLLKIFNRPLSPHLTIYSGQTTSIFSIWHRITGIVLILFVLMSLFTLKIISYKIFTQTVEININFWVQNTFFLNVFLFFGYHLINGIRHIIWDLGFAFSLETIQISVKLIIISLLFINLITFHEIIN